MPACGLTRGLEALRKVVVHIGNQVVPAFQRGTQPGFQLFEIIVGGQRGNRVAKLRLQPAVGPGHVGRRS